MFFKRGRPHNGGVAEDIANECLLSFTTATIGVLLGSCENIRSDLMLDGGLRVLIIKQSKFFK